MQNPGYVTAGELVYFRVPNSRLRNANPTAIQLDRIYEAWTYSVNMFRSCAPGASVNLTYMLLFFTPTLVLLHIYVLCIHKGTIEHTYQHYNVVNVVVWL